MYTLLEIDLSLEVTSATSFQQIKYVQKAGRDRQELETRQNETILILLSLIGLLLLDLLDTLHIIIIKRHNGPGSGYR